MTNKLDTCLPYNWQSCHLLIVCDIISWPLVTSVANFGYPRWSSQFRSTLLSAIYSWLLFSYWFSINWLNCISSGTCHQDLVWHPCLLWEICWALPHRRVLNKQSKFACYVSSPQQCALRKIESSVGWEVELKSTTIEQNKIFSSRRLLYCTGLGNDIFTLQIQPIQNTGDWNAWLHPWSYT